MASAVAPRTVELDGDRSWSDLLAFAVEARQARREIEEMERANQSQPTSLALVPAAREVQPLAPVSGMMPMVQPMVPVQSLQMFVDMSRSLQAKTEELMESQMDKVKLQSMLEMQRKEKEMQRREHEFH